MNAIADAVGDDMLRRATVTPDVILTSLEHGRRMHDPLTSHVQTSATEGTRADRELVREPCRERSCHEITNSPKVRQGQRRSISVSVVAALLRTASALNGSAT